MYYKIRMNEKKKNKTKNRVGQLSLSFCFSYTDIQIHFDSKYIIRAAVPILSLRGNLCLVKFRSPVGYSPLRTNINHVITISYRTVCLPNHQKQKKKGGTAKKSPQYYY